MTDNINNCVYLFDGQDRLIRKFGLCGTGNGQFGDPRGVSFDADNHLYVVEYSDNRVQKFDVNGTYLLQFGHRGSGNGQLNGPVGIVVHNDKAYVAEANNCRVSVFHCSGQFSYIIGSGQLSNPWGVAVTSNNQLLVADCNNSYIFRFTLDGTYLDRFGSRGSAKGQFSNPYGIAVSPKNDVYVTDYNNKRIQIF